MTVVVGRRHLVVVVVQPLSVFNSKPRAPPTTSRRAAVAHLSVSTQ